jgi:hypothetical protein
MAKNSKVDKTIVVTIFSKINFCQLAKSVLSDFDQFDVCLRSAKYI